jgi:hypothetical protein
MMAIGLRYSMKPFRFVAQEQSIDRALRRRIRCHGPGDRLSQLFQVPSFLEILAPLGIPVADASAAQLDDDDVAQARRWLGQTPDLIWHDSRGLSYCDELDDCCGRLPGVEQFKLLSSK